MRPRAALRAARDRAGGSRRPPPRARVFALSYTSMSLAQAAAPPLGGALAEWMSAQLVYLVASAGLLVTWACALALLGGVERRPEPEPGAR